MCRRNPRRSDGRRGRGRERGLLRHDGPPATEECERLQRTPYLLAEESTESYSSGARRARWPALGGLVARVARPLSLTTSLQDLPAAAGNWGRAPARAIYQMVRLPAIEPDRS